jgi:hypothetical protein
VSSPRPPLPPSPYPAPLGAAWTGDPLEVDRYLDGEGSPAERTARAGDVARDPALAQRLAARARFLALLTSARQTLDPHGALDEARLLAALRAEGEAARPAARVRRWRPLLGAAAALLVAFGAWSGWRDRGAEAVGHPAELAADLLDWVPRGAEGAAGCVDGSGASPQSFILVQDGELEIRACQDEGQGGLSQALLRRPEVLPAVGFVAVPAPGAGPSSEIGITEAGREGVVVFDLLDHGKRVYLAVDGASLRLRHLQGASRGQGEAWTCAACHGPARQAMPNPHRIVLRKPS